MNPISRQTSAVSKQRRKDDITGHGSPVNAIDAPVGTYYKDADPRGRRYLMTPQGWEPMSRLVIDVEVTTAAKNRIMWTAEKQGLHYAEWALKALDAAAKE